MYGYQALTEQQVLGLSLTEARHLTVADYADRRMTKAEFTHLAGLTGGYWEYLGEPRADAPHIRIRSGSHRGFYLNGSLILAETNICEILAAQAIEHLLEGAGEIDWVVTAALAGIPLGGEIARQLGARAGFVEEGDDGKLSGWRFHIPANSRVLVANELISTPDGSVFETKRTVAKENSELVEFLPFAAVLVDLCSAKKLVDETPIRALVKFEVQTFVPEECPYCAAGSEVIKGKINFRKLWAEQLAHQSEQQGEVNWQAGGQ